MSIYARQLVMASAGFIWSPSRVLGNFLIYREIDRRPPGGRRRSRSNSLAASLAHSPIKHEHSPLGSLSSLDTPRVPSTDMDAEKGATRQPQSAKPHKKDGLIKKSMSVSVKGVLWHMVSYYTQEDVTAGKLITPSSVPSLAQLEISPDMLLLENFRVPLCSHRMQTLIGAPFKKDFNCAPLMYKKFNANVDIAGSAL